MFRFMIIVIISFTMGKTHGVGERSKKIPCFIGFALLGKDIVFRFIIAYSSLRDFGPWVIGKILLLSYLGTFDNNYIIFRNVKISQRLFFSN
jgi:hypothetical protein